MAMTKDEIRESLRRGFSAYATKQLRAGLVLGGRLSVVKQNAALAKMPDDEFDALAREEMERAMQRMKAQQQAFHPAAPVQALEEVLS